MSRRLSLYINAIFIGLQLVLLALILFLPVDVNPICFITVCLGFLHAFLFFTKKKQSFFYLGGLLFTVVSDVFLVLRYTYTKDYTDQVIAMTTFSIAQLLYACYLFSCCENKKINVVHAVSRVLFSACLVVLTLLVLGKNANYLAVVALFYFANLILNAVFSLVELRQHLLTSIGFIAFIFCDLFIGLDIAVGSFIQVNEGSILYILANPGFNYAWLFYVISQTLLSLGFAFYKKRSLQVK